MASTSSDPASSVHRVFAYGTLKSGQPNNRHIKKRRNTKLVGPACTVTPFPLVIGTEWNLPFLLYAPGKGQVSECVVFMNFLSRTILRLL